jgi:hypothetical protein
MDNIQPIATTAQLLPPTANEVAAIRNALVALRKGPLDSAVGHLCEASRLASQACSPHARELANLANALSPAFETVKLVEMCLGDMFSEQ